MNANYLGHLELCEKALLDVTATFAPMLSQQPVNKLFLVWQCLSMSFWTQNSVGSRTLGELLMLLWMNKRTSQTSKTFQPFRIWDFKISGLWYVGFYTTLQHDQVSGGVQKCPQGWRPWKITTHGHESKTTHPAGRTVRFAVTSQKMVAFAKFRSSIFLWSNIDLSFFRIVFVLAGGHHVHLHTCSWFQ